MLKYLYAIFFFMLALTLIPGNTIGSTSSPTPKTSPVIQEKSLTPILPKGYKIISDSIKYSPDLRKVGYVAFSDDTHKIIIINKSISPVYYAVYPKMPIFSPANNHSAYIAYKSMNQMVVVVDGQPSKTLDRADNFLFSPDGSRYAYRAEKNKKYYITVDGKPGPIYDGIIVKKNFLFSPDSNRFFYVAYKNKACVAVIDSKEESSSYKLIENAIFSPDSNHYAYKARVERRGIKETWQVVQDGNPQTIYDKIFDIVFSSDSQHLAYAAVKDQKMVMVVDGEEINKSDIIGMPVFSLDSKIFAYACAKNDSWFIIVNDEKSPSFDQVYKFIFSLDSKRYSFIAKDGSEWFCNVDGQNGPGFDKSIDAFKFSSDSSRFAYVGINSEGSRVITEAGPLSETYFSVGEPYFSPDNRHFVFRAKKDKSSKWLIIIDGKKKYKPYHAIGKYYFSPDSRHIAAPVFHNINQTFMMVDGNEQCADTKFKILDTPYFSPDGNYVVYYGMKDDKDWHLIVNGVVLPNTYGGFFKGTPIIFDTSSSFHTLSLTEPGPEFISIDVDIPKSFPPLESGF